MQFTCYTKSTRPFLDQRHGTSGLRKPVTMFQQENYTENFIQCILSSLDGCLTGTTLVLGGDGRYYGRKVADTVIKMCAANGVRRVIVGKQAIMSTPAVSYAIRKYGANGGIILTASHNAGGPLGDFGIKFNIANGAPAPDHAVDKIHDLTKNILEYRICPELDCDIHIVSKKEFMVNSRPFEVEVIDPVEDYVEYMKNIFNFKSIQTLLQRSNGHPPMKFMISSMLGVTGPYVRRIFLEELKASPGCAIDIHPTEDFGGRYPDPNMTYAIDLIKTMKEKESDFGAAFDADGDRCMTLGHKAYFVSPSDTLAVITANATYIPYFKKNAIKGVGRSMPTSRAVDRVCKKKGIDLYEVPTGWKYFGNLMDAGLVSLCGEESFGTGSDHIREKDGIWVALAWMSILAARKLTVEEVLHRHWNTYGRNFFTRYDYVSCDTASCNKMMEDLEKMCITGSMVDEQFSFQHNSCTVTFTVAEMDVYDYEDPTNGTVVENQGVCILMTDDSRIVFRLSRTGTSNTTVRMYIESYESDPSMFDRDTQDVLKPLVEVALKISKLREYIGRQEPTLIT
ncbi:phosphoglucomutase-1-like [Panulirus ornatus]|uniref:phosphoglucomutase-1-like n=1 Tax=Panulirus ornatus TaxID=150431 RepID=UPI003A8661B4